jgi:hypothetical protein
VIDEFRDGCGVQDVAIPYASDLTWPEQPPLDSVTGEDFGVPNRGR